MAARMRVGTFISEGRFGGPQNRITQVASRLKDHGVDVTVVLPAKESKLFQQKLQAAEVPFICVNVHRLAKQTRELGEFVALFAPDVLRLARVLREQRFDIVHCNGARQWSGVVAGRLAGIKTIWHLNDTYSPWPFPAIFRQLAGACADGFISAGQHAQDFYLGSSRLAERPRVIIQAPVDTERFDPAKNEADAVIRALPGTKVITVANVSPDKDLRTFVRMCASLRDHDPPLSFVIVGTTFPTQQAYRNELEQICRREGLTNVHFVGPRDDIAAVMKSADIYVCSSMREASPMAVWEAMAGAKAIVSTDVGDVRRLLGDCGIVTPRGDAGALAEGVARLVADPELRTQLGARARQVAVERLDLEICARAHAAFYERMLGVVTRAASAQSEASAG